MNREFMRLETKSIILNLTLIAFVVMLGPLETSTNRKWSIKILYHNKEVLFIDFTDAGACNIEFNNISNELIGD